MQAEAKLSSEHRRRSSRIFGGRLESGRDVKLFKARERFLQSLDETVERRDGRAGGCSGENLEEESLTTRGGHCASLISIPSRSGHCRTYDHCRRSER